jgi:hypothetical protein
MIRIMGNRGQQIPLRTSSAIAGSLPKQSRKRVKSRAAVPFAVPVKRSRLRLRSIPAVDRLPSALRSERRTPQTHAGAIGQALACCVYCDDAMLANGLLALGSFLRCAPGGRGMLFVRGGGAALAGFRGLRGIQIVDSDLALRAARIGIHDWAREHDGIAEHYFRKVAMWLYVLEQSPAAAEQRYVFSDADVLFVRGIDPLLRHVRAHRFGAMVERWHQSLYAIYRQAPDSARCALAHLFHGAIDVRQMRQTPYYNTGLMLCRRDDRIHSAVKDVLMASMLYPELTRQVRFPEQTLLNLAMMVRGVRCRDLYGLCVPSYHDERLGWPSPVVRHYLGDSVNRRPAALASRHGEWVDQALGAVGTSVAELKEQGAWDTVPMTAPTLAPYPF